MPENRPNSGNTLKAMLIAMAVIVGMGGALARAADIDGSVDTTFAESGVAYVEDTSYEKMAVDSLGRFVLAESVDDDPLDYTGPDRIAITRLTADGAVDTSFGTDGVTVIRGLSGWSYLELYQVMVDANDRPVLVFHANGTNEDNFSAVVARLTTTGVLDTSFSSDGYMLALTPSSRSNSPARLGFIDATSNNIYLLGGMNGLDLFRITSAGVQDTSFFADGHMAFTYYYETSIPAVDMGFGFRGNEVTFRVAEDESSAMVAISKSVSDDGKLFIMKIDFSRDETVPFATDWGPDNYGVPVSYSGRDLFTVGADSTPDGFVMIDMGATANEWGLTGEFLADGTFYGITADTGESPYPLQLVKVAPDGTLDTDFAASGYTEALDLFGSYLSPKLIVNPEGTLTVVGKTDDYNTYARVVRFTAAGVVDTSFGTDGSVDIDTCERTTISAVHRDGASGSVFALGYGSTGYGDDQAMVTRLVKLGSGGSTTTCGTTTTEAGGGGGGNYTPPPPVSPAPTFSVGQSNGALVVCVAMNDSPATFLSTSVFPTDFQFGQSSNGDLLPDTNVQRTITGIADAADAYPRAEDWDGADVAIIIPQQRMLVYNDDWEADEVYEAQDWEIGTEYRVSLFASQVETSFMDQPIAQSMLDPVLYTFAATDTDCGIEPPAGTGSSSSTTTTTAPATTTTAAPTNVPTLVTSSNQELLSSSAGSAKILIDGELVDVELVQASEELRRTVGGARTFEQVRALQTLAAQMVTAIQGVLGDGVELPITVTNVDTGATISGLVTDPVTGDVLPVPVEDVLLILNENLVLMVGGADGANNPANIAFDGVLEFGEGGYVAVLAYGLTPGAAGEVVVMSTPQLLDTFTVGTDGGVAAQAAIPADLAPGEHTVVVAVDGQSASLGFRVLSAGVLPVTGGSSSLPSALAVLLAAAGAFGVLVVSRRRHTA